MKINHTSLNSSLEINKDINKFLKYHKKNYIYQK